MSCSQETYMLRQTLPCSHINSIIVLPGAGWARNVNVDAYAFRQRAGVMLSTRSWRNTWPRYELRASIAGVERNQAKDICEASGLCSASEGDDLVASS